MHSENRIETSISIAGITVVPLVKNGSPAEHFIFRSHASVLLPGERQQRRGKRVNLGPLGTIQDQSCVKTESPPNLLPVCDLFRHLDFDDQF